MADILETLRSGGPIIVVLLVLSLFSLALIVVKILQLRGVTGGDQVRAQAFESWAKGDRHTALQSLAARAGPADRLTHAAMEGLNAGKPRAAIEADLLWRGNGEVTKMNRHIRLLELIAMISPLLGLLGTVLGMIQSFQELALAEGAANASLLAGGIWQALLTTAAGLLVAIPAAVAASLLSDKVERAASTIESSIGQLFAVHEAG
jgi:biopolymer transport protein ExbB